MTGLFILLLVLVGIIAFVVYKISRPAHEKTPPSSQEEPPGGPLEPGAAPGRISSTDLVHVGAFPATDFFGECDARCKAPALVQVRLRSTGLRLALCRHHFRRSEAALRDQCDAVDDRSEALLGGRNA